jgi:hypothetical protein
MSMPSEPQSAPAYTNRNTAMAEGVHGSAGLAAQQQQANSGGPAKVRLTGSGNGMSAGQGQATMNGMLKPQNAAASDTYNNVKWQQDRE